MDFQDVLRIVGAAPVFETGLLLAGDVDAADVRRQLSRWTAAGKLFQLRRGLYALAPPWNKITPHPFLVANKLALGSYVSLESALAWHGLIPEHVPVTTSVTSGRPEQRDTPLGSFSFRHLKPELAFGSMLADLGGGQRGWVATPEKALLDLVYLVPEADDAAWLEELRLQHLETLDLVRLRAWAERSARPKLIRAAKWIASAARAEAAAS